MKSLTDQVEARGNPCVWLGDMLDTKEVIRGKCLNFWYEYFSQSKLHHTILVGNHDWFNLECEDHSLKTLKTLKNVNVVDKYQHTTGQAAYVPYIHDQKELKKVLARLKKDSVKYVFGHFEIKNFDYGNGRLCEEGLTAKSFASFQMVISGHFHKFQELKNIIYLGTPFSHSFGESNQDKFIAEMDLSTGQIEYIKTTLPQHLTIEFDCDILNETCDHVLLDYTSKFPTKENYYRVILGGKQENINRFPKYMYLDPGELNIKFVERPSDAGIIDVDIEDTATNEVQFTKWAKDIKGLEDDTIELGLQIMGAVK